MPKEKVFTEDDVKFFVREAFTIFAHALVQGVRKALLKDQLDGSPLEATKPRDYLSNINNSGAVTGAWLGQVMMATISHLPQNMVRVNWPDPMKVGDWLEKEMHGAKQREEEEDRAKLPEEKPTEEDGETAFAIVSASRTQDVRVGYYKAADMEDALEDVSQRDRIEVEHFVAESNPGDMLKFNDGGEGKVIFHLRQRRNE